MNTYFRDIILQKTGASSLEEKEVIQSLWSGYGAIIRVTLKGSRLNSVIVKNIQFPKVQKHPRGWNSAFGHQRKVKSYQVEVNWYQQYAQESKARLPKCYGIARQKEEFCLILEDLDAAGFTYRKQSLSWQGIENCLAWLANFHATYLDKNPKGLWPIGTYWHLATRPKELEILKDSVLKNTAPKIDEKLNNCTYKTLVHGDAKLANFCFSSNDEVAGVDFQYVGGGCGMKDVAYFIGSCLPEKDCERLEEKILSTYFFHLHKAFGKEHKALEIEWRELYAVAWADFHRFLKGWSPDHWKLNSYSERMTKKVIESL